MYPSSPPLPPPLSPGGALAAHHPVSRERQPGRNVAAAPDPLQLCNNRIPEEIRICKAWHLNWCWPGLQYTPSPFYINCSSVFSHKRQTEGERVGCTGTVHSVSSQTEVFPTGLCYKYGWTIIYQDMLLMDFSRKCSRQGPYRYIVMTGVPV